MMLTAVSFSEIVKPRSCVACRSFLLNQAHALHDGVSYFAFVCVCVRACVRVCVCMDKISQKL